MGGLVDIQMIKTMFNGLCYKLNFSMPLPTSFNTAGMIFVSNQNQELKKIKLMIAAENTWQGIIEQTWPYGNIPHIIGRSFSDNKFIQMSVKIDENLHKNRHGKTDFDECFEAQPSSLCLSIFDPRPNNNQ